MGAMDTKMTIGIPRGLLYHRYGLFWSVYFEELGAKLVYSPESSRALLEAGEALSADESCLSAKLFMGHVAELIGQCDYIFIPRISNFGHHRNMCVRFEALYDQCRTIFRESGQRFITCNVDVIDGHGEEAAYTELGRSLGFSVKDAKKAYRAAVKAEQKEREAAAKKAENLCKAEGLKILVCAHSYVASDPYIGQPVFRMLNELGTVPIRADSAPRSDALKKSTALSPTCKWEISREILGGISMYKKYVDGILLLSAFPCGPDAMVNDLIERKIKDVPLMNLVLDSQSGIAGLETRLESFVDILRMRKGAAL